MNRIEEHPIINTILNKIKNEYSKDISILSCYGSFVNGNANKLSDIDFYMVPKTNKGKTLSTTFIINEIGYDLWYLSWNKIEEISNLNTQFTSVLMDAKILYYNDSKDLNKIEILRENTKNILNDNDKINNICRQKIKLIQSKYYDYQINENKWEYKSIIILEDILEILANINGTYIHKGLYNINNEIKGYKIIPKQILNLINTIIKSTDKNKVDLKLKELINEIKNIINNDKTYEKKLDGFYEEIKSMYNKLNLACKDEDYLKSISTSAIIDEEIESIFYDEDIIKSFPKLTILVKSKNYQKVIKACIQHENVLLKIIEDRNIKINRYLNIKEFTRWFINR